MIEYENNGVKVQDPFKQKSNFKEVVLDLIGNRIFQFVIILVITLAALLSTLGPVSKVKQYIYDNATDKAYWLDVSQTSRQMYYGYYLVTFMDESDVDYNPWEGQNELYQEFYEDGEISIREREKLWSAFNYFYDYIRRYDENVMDMKHVHVQMMLLVFVQLSGVVAIGLLIRDFVLKNKLYRSKNIYLLSGLKGILLRLNLVDVMRMKSYAGSGLRTFIVLMFGIYIVMTLLELYNKNALKSKKAAFYGLRVLLSFIFLGLISTSFINMRFTYSDGGYVFGSFGTSDMNMVYDFIELDGNFLELNDNYFGIGHEVAWQLIDVDSGYFNLQRSMNNVDARVIMFYDYVKGTQPFFTIGVILLSAVVLGASLLNIYFSFRNYDGKESSKLRMINVVSIGCVLLLFAYSLVIMIRYNTVVRDELLRITVSYGLILSMIVLVGMWFFDKKV